MLNDCSLKSCLSVQAPVPCEDKVGYLEAEIQALKNVISDQHRYIQELHINQAQQLEHIPNSHLGPGNLYRGRTRSRREVSTMTWLFFFSTGESGGKCVSKSVT